MSQSIHALPLTCTFLNAELIADLPTSYVKLISSR